jgi:hypothetical protein
MCSTMNIATVAANGKHGDSFFPVARVVLTPVFLGEDAAFSFLAEGGPKSYRFNGTLGYIACEQHRFKVGGEYLSQKLHFKTHLDREHHWVHQWAVGGKYQYLFIEDCGCDWLKSFEFSGYYSKANSKDLAADTDLSSTGTFSRRIAGARSWGVEAGTTLHTSWNNGVLLLAIDYDNVEYKRRRHGGDGSGSGSGHHHDKTVSGVGGTVGLRQPLWYDVVLDFKYQYKRAYDYIEAMLDWRSNLECGDLDIGVFANHTFGKDRLPSSTTVGIELGFNFGVDNLFDSCCYDPRQSDCCVMDCNDLTAWVSEPAVYIPQVLAILREAPCDPPVLTNGPILTQFFAEGPININLNDYFSSPDGNEISYVVTGLPTGVTVNRHGVISGTVSVANAGTSTVTVTATDGCGTITTTFTLSLGAA